MYDVIYEPKMTRMGLTSILIDRTSDVIVLTISDSYPDVHRVLSLALGGNSLVAYPAPLRKRDTQEQKLAGQRCTGGGSATRVVLWRRMKRQNDEEPAEADRAFQDLGSTRFSGYVNVYKRKDQPFFLPKA
ncbi:hypothetical protein NDU88_007832 [Pleurodeles waltl]|uniref:Uncharacterized protein n=1 Tax=Pleurodeles waltl TaxID=8319 RepID=A0AAV7PUL2_PLEWA|nr:hypothetical protein NDU88_007832 [Pleurodeles waltl]